MARAEKENLDLALAAVARGFQTWKKISAFERSKMMRAAGELVRARVDSIARELTAEQGKPIAEARMEVLAGADIIDWFAEEARRTYGRVIPARAEGFISSL